MFYDAITVGGSLGGATLAKTLAENGFRVLILERQTRFEDQVRGEQFHPWGVTEARKLGIYDQLAHTCGYQTRWWRTYRGKRLIRDRDMVVTTPHRAGSFNCYHPAMQETVLNMAEACGAEVRRGIKVEKVLPGPTPAVTFQHAGLTQTLQARLVVGADGRESQVRRWGGFDAQSDPDRLVIAGTLFKGMSLSKDATFVVKGDVGMMLVAPLGNDLTRIYYIARKEDLNGTLQGKSKVAEFIAACLNTGVSHQWFKGARVVGPLAQVNAADTWVDHPAKDGVVLIGDAAAASDPCYGCGLSLTLMDVRHLRDALLSNSNWHAAIHEYAEQHDHYYGTLHKLTHWLTELRWSTGRLAERRRARVFPQMAVENGLAPDIRGLGPESPSDEKTRRFLFAEDEEEEEYGKLIG